MDAPCATDRTSLVGLRPLIRDRPRTWHEVLIDNGQPRWPDLAADDTIATVLRSGHVADLNPRSAGDGGRLRRARGCARRLVRAVGDRAMAQVDDEFVERLRRDLTCAAPGLPGAPIAASTAARTLTMLRKAARVWAEETGRAPGVTAQGTPPRTRVGERRPRPVPPFGDLLKLLRAADPQLRAAIGLAVGAGLNPGEIAGLRRSQLLGRGTCVVLWASRPGASRQDEQVRYAWIPPWAQDLLRAGCPALAGLAESMPLFPFDNNPRLPTKRLPGALRRTCRWVWPDRDSSYTFSDLRRAWQAVCRAHSLPREVVRQTWATPPIRGRNSVPLPAGAQRLADMTAFWRRPGGGPGAALLEPAPVPAVAPKGIPAWAPEPVGRSGPADLPESCRG